MAKLNLLKGFFRSLALGVTLSLPLIYAAEPVLLPPILSPRTAPLLEEKYRVKPDQSDFDISTYLQDKCQDNKERAIIYVPKTRRIEDISHERFETRVTFQDHIIENRLKEYHDIIFAHSHIIALSEVYNARNQEHYDAMSKFGEYRLRRRMMRETPTGYYSDFQSLLLTLFNTQSNAMRDKNSPPLNLDSRIVILDRWVDPRVLSYGINKKLFKEIKDFDYRDNFGLYMRNLKIDREIAPYESIFFNYKSDHADIFEISDKPEPSFPEFAALVNKKTNFFILDHGYIKTR